MEVKENLPVKRLELSARLLRSLIQLLPASQRGQPAKQRSSWGLAQRKRGGGGQGRGPRVGGSFLQSTKPTRIEKVSESYPKATYVDGEGRKSGRGRQELDLKRYGRRSVMVDYMTELPNLKQTRLRFRHAASQGYSWEFGVGHQRPGHNGRFIASQTSRKSNESSAAAYQGRHARCLRRQNVGRHTVARPDRRCIEIQGRKFEARAILSVGASGMMSLTRSIKLP